MTRVPIFPVYVFIQHFLSILPATQMLLKFFSSVQTPGVFALRQPQLSFVRFRARVYNFADNVCLLAVVVLNVFLLAADVV